MTLVRDYDSHDLDGETVIALIRQSKERMNQKRKRQRKKDAMSRLWQRKIRKIKERYLYNPADHS